LRQLTKIIQDRSGKARSEKPYLKKLDLATPSLTSRRNSHRRTKGRRTLIEEVVSSMNTKAKKKTIKLTLNYCETTFYWKTPAIDQVSHSSRRRQGRPEERGPIDGGDRVPAARASERRQLFFTYDLSLIPWVLQTLPWVLQTSQYVMLSYAYDSSKLNDFFRKM
jgi:hypothetical protein